MSTTTDARTVRLREIAKRWPRFAWDYRGLTRWQSFDESFWTGLLAAGALIATGYSDLPVWWEKIPFLLPVLSEAGGTPRGNILLSVLILLNVWVLDRHLAAKIPAGLSEIRWLRAVRVIASSIPLLGLAVIPVWQELIRRRPSWAFVHRSAGPAGWWKRIDARLRSWSQHLIPQIFWLVGCQLTPLFSGLYLLSQCWPAAAMAVNVLLHLTGAVSAAAHVALRIQILQMTGRRAFFFRLLPLALLLPIPFSPIAALIWLPSAEPGKEDKGVVQTLYRSRITRRHPFAAIRGPRMGEITGSREDGRRRASAIKIGFLALESAVLAGIVATFGSPLVSDRNVSVLFILCALSIVPGAFLLVAGAVARSSGRWQGLAFLADHPYGPFLTLLPLALMIGALAGTLAGSHDIWNLRVLLIGVGFAGILMTLLAMMWTFLLSLFFGVPDRPITGPAISFVLFALILLLSSVLSAPTFLRPLSALIALASPLAGIGIAFCWLAPFRLRDLNDRRLPSHLRVRLWGLAVTAILPLGGLAIPAWIRLRHRHGPELDRWAALLREPAT
ncbi:MAG TPA: hypothetical protein VKM72_06670 [Thermoanaerobaculia bacterium]|nr:hypothetical protein [Thermoanaerobaculia bacterium]